MSQSKSALRRITRPVLLIVVLGFAVHVLLPQVGELKQGLEALRSGRWPFLGLGLMGAGLTFLGSAWAVRVSVDSPPPWSRTTVIQLAASAASVLTPMGVGWVFINEGFLRQSGVEEGAARAATGLNMVLTAVSHVLLLVVVIPFLPTLHLPTIAPPQRRVFVDIVVIAAVVFGVVFWIPRVRTRVLTAIRPTIEAIPLVLGNPRRSLLMVGAAVSVNFAYALALYGTVAAFGASPAPLGILVSYLLAATVAAVAPTPGGLGAMETALVSALTRLAVPAGAAVAATLAFRLLTFWLPLALGAVALRRVRSRGWI